MGFRFEAVEPFQGGGFVAADPRQLALASAALHLLRPLAFAIEYDDFGRITSLPSQYSGGGALSTTYYSNDLVHSQTQDGLTNTYELDAALRQRRRVQSGSKSGAEIYHYADGSDSPVWIDRGEESWTRNIPGLGGGLGAIQDSGTGTTLQLTNLHGDVVATASLDPEATGLLSTFEFDEFGNPKGETTPKYGWLGGKQRRTELPSGVIQMGVRSYVPAMGRFTAVDPVEGGSANAYEYAMAEPINMFDLDGREPKANARMAGCGAKLRVRSRRKRFYVRMRARCMSSRLAVVTLHKVTISYERNTGCGSICLDLRGRFDPVSTGEVRPRRPNAMRWRKWGVNESYDCEPGTEYQYHIKLMYTVQTVAGGIFKKQSKTLSLKGQTYCRR